MLQRVLLPLSIMVGGYLGYAIGPSFSAPLDHFTEETFLGFVPKLWWQWIGQWGSVLWLATSGGVSFYRYKSISQLRWQYEVIYFRFYEVLTPPGNRISDFVWAYVFGTAIVTACGGTILYTCLILPAQFTSNILLEIILALLFGVATAVTALVAYNVIDELFRPRELEDGVQFCGFNIDFFQAHREELQAAHHQRKGYSVIPYEESSGQPDAGGELNDW